jgi:hypothetical protein
MSYPQNIDPAILMKLAQMAQSYRPGETATPWLTDPSGMGYTAGLNQGAYGGEGSTPTYSLGDKLYAGNYTADKGGQMGVYDGSGKATGATENWKPDDWNYDTAAMLAAAGFGGMFGAMAPGMTGAGMTGGGNGALGAANGSWDVLPEASWGGSGGEGVAAGVGDGAGGGAGVTGFGDAGTMYAGSNAAAAGSLGGGASIAGGAALGAGGAGGGLLSSLGGAGSLLGPAATILGGLAGAQGKQNTQTTQQSLPDYLKPYVTAPGGLLDSANSLMKQQMGYVPQQGQQISQMGMGLLQQPIAGNGYAMFAAKPRFGG